MTRLGLLRHAKSDYPPGVGDHDRTLSRRGERDASAVGTVIAARLGRPDLVLVSTATRAQLTWERAASTWTQQPREQDEPRIYEAEAATLLHVVHELGDELETVLLVGHNPGIAELASALTGETGDAAALERLQAKYPTCALAIFDVPVPWRQLTVGEATLLSFHTPR
jgi:phosphohistidine phosphatase